MGKHAGEPEGRTDGSWIGNDDEVVNLPVGSGSDDNAGDEGNVIELPKS